jgi:hypothetical protein
MVPDTRGRVGARRAYIAGRRMEMLRFVLEHEIPDG